MSVKISEEKMIKLREIIHIFYDNIRQYKKSTYDEANTRVDFIDKFFELLDWDVRNTQGYSEAYREVVREDKIIITGKPKAPDYSFRIGGRKFFFVEAKKPCVNIKEERDPALQLRRYGYTAKLPLSILTDFEEFAVYDTRIKPIKTDKASTARIFYCEFIDLLKQNALNPEITNFEYIYSVFSKNAILKGSFDRYIEETKNKKGTSEVDKEILKLIDDWRCELAKNIALRNTELDVYNLNYAVQKIIDRIIFLRIAEDRNTEDYGKLQSILTEKEIYIHLVQLFNNANKKYNSGLFTHQQYLDELQIDNKVLSAIINSFYYPECPYEFSILPIEILGNAYEQFLGKKIRLTPSHHAIIEEKPEVRKAGGVYYTPQYIVDYIVESTVSEKVNRRKPEDIENLRIIDPACGSGSFLVRAYDFLLKYHIKYYCQKSKLESALKKGKIYQVDETTYYLSIIEKQRILLNNIYGVDIDEQAVEVTKLSLLLKLMENEGVEYTDYLFKHHDLILLPDLSNNIKCGNSLIGSDFYNDKDLGLFNKDEIRKVNVFDWEKEFPAVFADGGFDCVIGNPPYFNLETTTREIKNYLSQFSKVYAGKSDILYFFFEKGINILKNAGILSFITSRYYIEATYAKNLRVFIGNNTFVKELYDFSDYSVFQGIGIHTVITILVKQNLKSKTIIKIFDKNFMKPKQFEVNLDNYNWIIANDLEIKLLNKIKTNVYFLGDIAIIEQGQKTGKNDVFGISLELYQQLEKEPIKKLIKNSHIHRYYINFRDIYLIYTDDTFDLERNPKIKNYLLDFKTELKNRAEACDNKYPWYRLQRPRRRELFDAKEKIIVPYRADYNKFAYDDQQYYNDGGDIRIIVLTNSKIGISIKYCLGILNSKLMNFYYKFIGRKKGNMLEYFVEPLSKIPIKIINFNNNYKANIYNNLISLVDQMLEIQKQFHSAKSEADRNIYKKKIDLLDKQIDTLVYQLYEFTDEEIKIVEES